MGLGCGYNRVWISVTTSIRFKSRVKAWIRFRVRARVRVEVRANFGLGLQPGLGLEILLVFKLGYLRLGLGARLAFQTTSEQGFGPLLLPHRSVPAGIWNQELDPGIKLRPSGVGHGHPMGILTPGPNTPPN